MNKPFFSFVIPTYNRSKYLKRAISAILLQSYKNYEIIISDNNSTDDTFEIVKKFRTKKIRYYKNPKNIGVIRNLQKSITHVKGKYIFFFGDDDFLVSKTSLENIARRIKTTQPGFIRVNYANISPLNNDIFTFHPECKNDKHVLPNSSNEEICSFIESVDPYFISGIIVKADLIRDMQMLISEYVPWFPILFQQTQKNGGYFIANYFIAASWSISLDYSRYYLRSHKFQFEAYFTEVKKRLSEKAYKQFLKNKMNQLIKELPANKYYTNIGNMLVFANRIIAICPEYKYSLFFYFYVLISIFLPRFILSLLRKYSLTHMQKVPIRDKVIIEKQLYALQTV